MKLTYKASKGSKVTLTATPAPGYKFYYWRSDNYTLGNGDGRIARRNPLTIPAIYDTHNIVAQFKKIESDTTTSITENSDNPITTLEEFTNLLSEHVPVPNYDTRHTLDKAGIQPYYQDGNTTTSQNVAGKANGFAFTPAISNKLQGYGRLEITFSTEGFDNVVDESVVSKITYISQMQDPNILEFNPSDVDSNSKHYTSSIDFTNEPKRKGDELDVLRVAVPFFRFNRNTVKFEPLPFGQMPDGIIGLMHVKLYNAGVEANQIIFQQNVLVVSDMTAKDGNYDARKLGLGPYYKNEYPVIWNVRYPWKYNANTFYRDGELERKQG